MQDTLFHGSSLCSDGGRQRKDGANSCLLLMYEGSLGGNGD